MRNNFKISIIEKIQLFFIALYSLGKVIIAFLDNKNFELASDLFKSVIMYIILILTIVNLVKNGRVKVCIKNSLFLIFSFLIIILHQKIFCPESYIADYFYNIFLVGFGGFIIGFSITNYRYYIYILGLFSSFFGLFLIFEPLNGNLLGLSSMVLGYTLMPLSIYCILFYFIIKRTFFIKMIALGLSLSVILFTSRGCGLTIILFWIICNLRILSKRKFITKYAVLFLFILVFGMFFLNYLEHSDSLNILEGSFLSKYASGELTSDNGRYLLYEHALFLIKGNWMLGVGIGVDRLLIGDIAENYTFAHNVVLELILNFGVFLGLGLFFLYVKSIIQTILKEGKSEYSLFLIALFCSVCIRLFVSDSYINNMYGLMFVLGIAMNRKYTKSLKF